MQSLIWTEVDLCPRRGSRLRSRARGEFHCHPCTYLKRGGGQYQFSAVFAAEAKSDSDRFSELEQWIAEHLKSDLRVEALEEREHMSPRNFARLYAKSRGRTPAKAVEAIRIDEARR